MRMRRMRSNYSDECPGNDFINEIKEEVNKKGIKNAVCIVLSDNDELSIINAFDDSIQIAGILDLGKSLFHDEVLEGED